MESRPKTVLTGRMGKEDAEAFDAFAAANPRADYRQSRAWAENAPRSGRQDYLFFLCRVGAEVIGSAVVRRSRLAPGVSLATVQRGPLVADTDRLEQVVAALKQALKQAGFSSLVLGPRFAGEARQAALETLRRCGFVDLSPAEQALHVVTGKVALEVSEEAILASFKQRGRRAIRKAAERATVREAGEADLPACQELLDAFHARRPDYDARSQPDVAAQARLVAALGGGLLVAEEEGRVVGFHSFVRQGRDAIWLAMAGDDDPKAPRGYLLVWEAVRRARALGLSSYDLAGLAPEGAESGRDQFKTAFAPEREDLLPAHVAPLRPLRHAVFFTLRRHYRARRR